MKKIVVVVLFIGISLGVQSQISNYLTQGKSGFGIQVLGEQGPKFQGFGGGIGASLRGKFDVSLLGISEVLGKEANNLVTDKATGTYYEAKVTWWLFRNEISPMINVSFGLLAGLDGSSYKDFRYLNQKTSSIVDYKSFIAGMAGIQAAVCLKLSENWILQPTFIAYYDFGKQLVTESATEFSSTYTGVISNICISLIRRIGEGNALVLSLNNYSQTSGSGSFCHLTAGYVFSF
jgi:hypothetical protein